MKSRRPLASASFLDPAARLRTGRDANTSCQWCSSADEFNQPAGNVLVRRALQRGGEHTYPISWVRLFLTASFRENQKRAGAAAIGVGGTMLIERAGSYRAIYDAFRWEVPPRFNMAQACCDRWADDPGRTALIHECSARDAARGCPPGPRNPTMTIPTNPSGRPMPSASPPPQTPHPTPPQGHQCDPHTGHRPTPRCAHGRRGTGKTLLRPSGNPCADAQTPAAAPSHNMTCDDMRPQVQQTPITSAPHVLPPAQSFVHRPAQPAARRPSRPPSQRPRGHRRCSATSTPFATSHNSLRPTLLRTLLLLWWIFISAMRRCR